MNPELPDTAIQEAATRVHDVVFATDLVLKDGRLHDLLVNGVALSYFADGEKRNARVQPVDWTNESNDWRAVNQVDIDAAYRQIDTYKEDIPDLFRPTLLTVISDGFNARYGSLSAGLDRFMRWRTVDGETIEAENSTLA